MGLVTMPKKKNIEYVIIVGCGRIGSRLANELSKLGVSIVVIDIEPKAFSNLDESFSGFMIEGDGIEAEVLEEAKIKEAHALIVSTSKDAANMMIAQIGKEIYKVETVLARIVDPAERDTYNLLEIETISPTVLASNLIIEKMFEEDQ